jgi:hypothetical protein
VIAGVTLSHYYESVPSYGGWKYDYSGLARGRNRQPAELEWRLG